MFLYIRERVMIASGIKRGTAELAILSVLQTGALHGYEIARRIEQETNGSLRFTLAALYPMLYRLENQKWIRGTWETSPTGRRRRCYRLTAAGKQKISPLRKEWSELFAALQRLAGVSNA
jgi:PadR family transcriptional regulator, regulatory protein PadR